MLNNIKKQQGFTIVELLIVIVVIAILAAISIVAYNGIQNRGKSATGQSLANSIDKKVEAYNTLNSKYPTYCEFVMNTKTATGSAPAAGTTGTGTCAGAADAGGEAKVDSTAALTPASAAAGTGYTPTVSDNNKVVGYYFCSATAGVNIFYVDFANSSNIITVKAGAGC